MDTLKRRPAALAFAIFFVVMAVYSLWRMFAITPWYDETVTYMDYIDRGSWYCMTNWPQPTNHVFYCLLSSLPFDVQIDSETDSEIYLLPTGSFRQIMEENIYVENFIYKMMTESFSDIIAAVQQMLFGSLKQRLISFLLDESSRCGSLEIHMTQEQIARSIGSAREAVSRVLKQMAREGDLQLFRGGVRLLEKKRLYQML